MNGRTDRGTDRQKDRQGQILMPPDYCHGGIKNLENCVCNVKVKIAAILQKTHAHLQYRNNFKYWDTQTSYRSCH